MSQKITKSQLDKMIEEKVAERLQKSRSPNSAGMSEEQLYSELRGTRSEVINERLINSGMKDEVNGILRYGPHFNRAVHELVLTGATWRMGILGFWKSMGEGRWPVNKILLTAVALVVTYMILGNPTYVKGINDKLSDPNNQLIFVVLVVMIAGMGYWLFTRKKKQQDMNR